jgi:hypothetical protein
MLVIFVIILVVILPYEQHLIWFSSKKNNLCPISYKRDQSSCNLMNIQRCILWILRNIVGCIKIYKCLFWMYMNNHIILVLVGTHDLRTLWSPLVSLNQETHTQRRKAANFIFILFIFCYKNSLKSPPWKQTWWSEHFRKFPEKKLNRRISRRGKKKFWNRHILRRKKNRFWNR